MLNIADLTVLHGPDEWTQNGPSRGGVSAENLTERGFIGLVVRLSTCRVT